MARLPGNPPITLDKTIDLAFGTVTSPPTSGYPSLDGTGVSALLSTDVLNAILAEPGLDPRLIAGLTELRDSPPANPSDLTFFTTTADQPEAAFGGQVQKPAPGLGAAGALVDGFQGYGKIVTAGAGFVAGDPRLGGRPFTLDFPNLTTNASGQVVNGHLTVNLVVYDAGIFGQIGTVTHLSASQSTRAPGKPVSFTATLVGNGAVSPATAGTAVLTFYDGTNLLGTAPVGRNGKARFTTSSLGLGPHAISAVYAGNAVFTLSRSNTASVTVAPPDGPRVVRIERDVPHGDPTVVRITFDSALNPASATHIASYRIVGVESGKLVKTRQYIAIASVTYQRRTNTVIIRTRTPLNLDDAYQIRLFSTTKKGIAGITGLHLDGNGDGKPGGNFVVVVARGDFVFKTPRPTPP
jgi:hypothetical protein